MSTCVAVVHALVCRLRAGCVRCRGDNCVQFLDDTSTLSTSRYLSLVCALPMLLYERITTTTVCTTVQVVNMIE